MKNTDEILRNFYPHLVWKMLIIN